MTSIESRLTNALESIRMAWVNRHEGQPNYGLMACEALGACPKCCGTGNMDGNPLAPKGSIRLLTVKCPECEGTGNASQIGAEL